MTRAALAVSLFALALVLSPTPASARMYQPCAASGPTDTTPGAASDLTFHFGVGLGPDCEIWTSDDRPDYMPDNVTSYTPTAWGVATDAEIPDGTVVGHLEMKQTFGILNNACNLRLTIDGDLIEATTSQANVINPLPNGKANRLKPLAQDADHNGIIDAADHWPSYLQLTPNRILRERLVAVNTTSVSGTAIVVNLLVYEPPATSFANLGYSTQVIFQDPTGIDSSQDTVTDECSPSSTDWTLFGEANGLPFRTNPPDGKYRFATYSRAQPDADDDGIENSLDPCPFTPDLVWSPRAALEFGVTPGDPDIDGLPDSCDPNLPRPICNVDGACVDDEDRDGWFNRGDNCPLVANRDQTDSDGDGIGNVCDLNPHDFNALGPNGIQPEFCNVSEVIIGTGHSDEYTGSSLCWLGGFGSATCGRPPHSLVTDAIAVLAELAGVYQHTICFPDSDFNCNGILDTNDATRMLLLAANPSHPPYIHRPCNFLAH